MIKLMNLVTESKLTSGDAVTVLTGKFKGQLGLVHRTSLNGKSVLVKMRNGDIEGFTSDNLTTKSIREAPETRRKSKSNYAIYHKTMSSAVGEAIAFAQKYGFEVDEESLFQQVTTGPRKPSAGKTNSYKLELTKAGKSVRKMLIFQVYGLDGPSNNDYELTVYIS
jgi:ribosomal protein L24